jgi:hypothetical protein
MDTNAELTDLIISPERISVDYWAEVKSFASQYNDFELEDDDFPTSGHRESHAEFPIRFVKIGARATTAEVREAIVRKRYWNANLVEALHFCQHPMVWRERPVTIAVIGSVIKKDGLIWCPVLSANHQAKTARLLLDGGESVWMPGTLFPVISRN